MKESTGRLGIGRVESERLSPGGLGLVETHQTFAEDALVVAAERGEPGVLGAGATDIVQGRPREDQVGPIEAVHPVDLDPREQDQAGGVVGVGPQVGESRAFGVVGSARVDQVKGRLKGRARLEPGPDQPPAQGDRGGDEGRRLQGAGGHRGAFLAVGSRT